MGSKHHILTDACGIPLSTKLTQANRHDVTQLIPLVEGIPAIKGRVGRPKRRPQRVQGDRAYDSNPHRMYFKNLGIEMVVARRGSPHGSGLGTHRWVVERTISWLHQNKRLRVRSERRDDIHEAFMALGCSLICYNFLRRKFC